MANGITLFRLLLVPIFVYLMFFYPKNLALIIGIFGLAALSDFLDGFVARRSKVTEFGQRFDPLVDRFLVLTALVMLYIKNILPWWTLTVALGRDLLLLLGYGYLHLKKEKISVTFLGKAGLTIILLSFFLILFKIEEGKWLFYFGLGVYVLSAFDYTIKGVQLIQGEKLKVKS